MSFVIWWLFNDFHDAQPLTSSKLLYLNMAMLQKQSGLEGIELNLQGNISIKRSCPVQLISGNPDAAF